MQKQSIQTQHEAARDLQQTEQSKKSRQSSAKFKFNRQNIIRRSSQNIWDKYRYVDKIGEGSFGEVFKITHKQLQIVRALKVIKKSSPDAHNHDSYKELQILKKLDHPNVLKIYEYFETETEWMIITEYFEGKQLFEEIIMEKKLTQRKAALIFAEICKAVAYIHAHSIVHRDIKPENILVRRHNTTAKGASQGTDEEYQIKLIDWGLGSTSVQQLMKKCGTPEYCAPEVLEGLYGHQCDLWSLGVLLFVMLVGRFPFKGHSVHETLQQVSRANLNFKAKQWQQISIEAKHLISLLIVRDPKRRLQANEILKHEWVLYHIEKSQTNRSSQQIEIDDKLLVETLHRLQEVTIDNKFQAVVINFIHNYMLAEEKEYKLKQQFEMLDQNHDGELSYYELLKGYEKIYPNESKERIESLVGEIFKNIDLDGSGSISYSEFITFATKISNKFSEKQLKEVFSLLDEDGNGRINKKQINEILMYEKGVQSQEFDKILKEIDLDGDGDINYGEFLRSINSAVAKVLKDKRQRDKKTRNSESKSSKKSHNNSKSKSQQKEKEKEKEVENKQVSNKLKNQKQVDKKAASKGKKETKSPQTRSQNSSREKKLANHQQYQTRNRSRQAANCRNRHSS